MWRGVREDNGGAEFGKLENKQVALSNTPGVLHILNLVRIDTVLGTQSEIDHEVLLRIVFTSSCHIDHTGRPAGPT
jgi:hypothetical protein